MCKQLNGPVLKSLKRSGMKSGKKISRARPRTKYLSLLRAGLDRAEIATFAGRAGPRPEKFDSCMPLKHINICIILIIIIIH